jgi:hypothetical protein
MTIEDVAKGEAPGHVRKLVVIQTVAKLNFEVHLINVGHVAVDVHRYAMS